MSQRISVFLFLTDDYKCVLWWNCLFRLQNMPKVCYSEIRQPKEEKRVIPNSEIHIEEGSNPEHYTEEHEKILGDSKTPWTLFIDGYDEEGQRIYDKFLGKSCHQCRFNCSLFMLSRLGSISVQPCT